MLFMKTIMITGSSRGIGKATALAFAGPETKLILVCRTSVAKLDETKKQAEALGATVFGFQCDLSDAASVKELFAELETANLHPDILVNNAGISYVGLLQDMSDTEWHNVINSNLSSVFYCSRGVIPGMLKKGHGTIINVSSIWGSRGASCEVAYSASKGGVEAFTKALAKELAPSGIRVNSVSCGITDTDMNSHLSDEEKADFTESVPIGRMAKPEEIAAAIVSLSNAGDYITGQIIGVDGGF